jgi:hypothetical protein
MNNNILLNMKHKRCVALNYKSNELYTNDRCPNKIIGFSTGIYLCEQHGFVIFSPYNTYNMLIYNLNHENHHSNYKLINNNFFKSNIYNRNLVNKRYKKVILKFLKNNLHNLIDDVKHVIIEYL